MAGATGVLSLGTDGNLTKGGSGDAPTCTNTTSFFAVQGKDGDKPYVRYDFGAEFSVKTPVAAGVWKLEKDKTTPPLATFDFAYSAPVTTDGKPRVFIPTLRLTADTGTPRLVRELAVEWYAYDPSKSLAYVKVEDAETIKSAIYNYKLFLRDANGNATIVGKKFEEAFDVVGPAITEFKYVWRIRPDTQIDDPKCADDLVTTQDPGALLDNVGISYAMAGVTYSWVWGKLPTKLPAGLCP